MSVVAPTAAVAARLESSKSPTKASEIILRLKPPQKPAKLVLVACGEIDRQLESIVTVRMSLLKLFALGWRATRAREGGVIATADTQL